MKAYKGFNADMTCRGFKFEIGKTYEESDAKLCEVGFHACLDPLECYHYYPPSSSVYCEVDIEDNGERERNSTKVVGKKITIVRKITSEEIARIHNSISATNDFSLSAGDHSSLSAGDLSSLSAGDFSSLSAGDFSSISADDRSAISAGNYSHLSAGRCSSLSAGCASFLSARNFSCLSADCYSSLSAGDYSTISARSDSSISAGCNSAVSAHDRSAISAKADSVLCAFNSRCRAGMNSVIAIANRGKDGCIIDYAVGIVDGVHLLPDVWYVNRGGKLVKWEEVTQ